MNFTIATQNNTLKRIKTRYVLAAAGAALVVAAFVTSAELRSSSSPAPGPVQPATPNLISQSHPQDIAVYIVGSQYEKALMEQNSISFKQWLWESEGATTATRVVVIEPGVEESFELLGRLVPEASFTTLGGPKLTFVDMR